MPVIPFVTVDVFTEQRFAGNPLGVVPDARGLSAEQMQHIATEFGYSESTFVLPPDDPTNDARVRIFTPTTEIPFAGHPNVGTAFVLGHQQTLFGKPLTARLRFEEIAGLVDVELLKDASSVAGATIRAPRPLELGASVEPATVAACASIDPAQIAASAHQPRFVSVGLPFVIAELVDRDALAAAKPNLAAFHEAAAKHRQLPNDFPIFLYLRALLELWHIRARMFAPLDDVPEDPATGSASAALGAFLVTELPEPDIDVHLTIEQGVEMGRRSIIEVDVVKRDGKVTDIRISGRCVFVMRGTIDC